ncbi:transcriptional initiation protein Tat [Methylobacterium oryzisoli]|uniref:thiosulfate dehydrogenase n=1 Tax=Methylobacterium oryzisoli TaxID=3385502 RepID=UPI00389161CC
MTYESAHPSRRIALGVLSQAALLAGAGAATPTLAAPPPRSSDPGREALDALTRHLADAPRRRTFGTVPLVVTSRDQWDHEAAEAVLAYKYRSLQVWECTQLASPWLNLMREAMTGQVFAHDNPGFLAVAAVHGSAHLALFDQVAWDTHNLASLAGNAASRNSYFHRKPGTSPADSLQSINGYYGPENNNICTLQERGAVFVACHDSIHAIARIVHQRDGGSGPSADMIAADLTNHLVPGAVLVPSVVAFLVELQRTGFTYAKGD